MKVIRNSDNTSFYVYDIKILDNNISFLIFDIKINKWTYCNANQFTPVEDQYFG